MLLVVFLSGTLGCSFSLKEFVTVGGGNGYANKGGSWKDGWELLD